MKPLNFLKSISPARQKEVRVWLFSTVLSVGGLTLALIFLFGVQLYFLRQVREQCCQITGMCGAQDVSLVNRKQSIEKDYAQLMERETKLSKAATINSREISAFTALCAACKKGACPFNLQAIQIDKHSVMVSGSAAKHHAIPQILKHLSETTGYHFTIKSMHNSNERILFQAQGIAHIV